jgi:hypothetical protein
MELSIYIDEAPWGGVIATSLVYDEDGDESDGPINQNYKSSEEAIEDLVEWAESWGYQYSSIVILDEGSEAWSSAAKKKKKSRKKK